MLGSSPSSQMLRLGLDGASTEGQSMGDFIEAFAAFVGTEALGPAEGTEQEAEPPEGPAEASHEVEDSTAIVESILDDLLTPLDGATYIVQSILDDLISDLISAPTLTPATVPLARPAAAARVVRGKVQPPTLPSPDHPGRSTNQLLFMKRKVMPAIWAHKFTWPFKKPVDAIKLGIPDYHNIVKQPMDFGTVRKRLNNKYYWSGSECRDDIRLVFSNCFLYNKPELDISMMARTLEKVCEGLMERMPEVEEEEGPKPAVKRKGRPPGEPGHRKRAHYDADYVSKKARRGSFTDFESDIPVAQVGTHMGAYGLAPGRSTKGDDTDSEDTEEDESISESEFDDLELARAPGARPSNHRPVPVPRTFQDERPGGLLTERKTIKNYCKYCDQAFLSKYVRDMHEKVKHGSGYVSAEKPKKMPVIKKPKKEPKSLQILPVKTEPNIDLPAGMMDFGQPPEAQFTDQDLLNFVDKKHQAMSKHGKKNQSKPPQGQHNIRIPEDMLFPVPEELLLKEGYMHTSAAPPTNYAPGNGAVNGLGQQVQTPALPKAKQGVAVISGAKAPKARPPRAPKAPAPRVQAPPLVPQNDSKYDLQKELGFMEPTFTKSGLVTPSVHQSGLGAPRPPPSHQLYPRTQPAPAPAMPPSNGPSQEAIIMARNAMRIQSSPGQHSPLVLNSQQSLASYSPQHVQRSTSLGYEALRSPEMQLAASPRPVHRRSIEERSPGPFLPQQQQQQQQRPAVIQENSYRPATVLKATSRAAYSSPEPVVPQQAPRPIALESRSVIFPSKPLPKEDLKSVQVMQAAPAYRPPPASKPPDDLLAQTLQLSEIDGFDFTEEKDMPNLVSTQELTLGDLKHLSSGTITIPNAQMRVQGQGEQVQTNGHEKLEDLLDFSNITYQDVRQLIGPTENMVVYPEADGAYSEVIASGSQQRVMVQPAPAASFSSAQSFTLQSASLTTSTPAGSSMPTFDMASLVPTTVFNLQEQKPKRPEEKWWA